jgi:uncharacterized membrane protein YdjX (TVP38/TMEM64 family)
MLPITIICMTIMIITFIGCSFWIYYSVKNFDGERCNEFQLLLKVLFPTLVFVTMSIVVVIIQDRYMANEVIKHVNETLVKESKNEK